MKTKYLIVTAVVFICNLVFADEARLIQGKIHSFDTKKVTLVTPRGNRIDIPRDFVVGQPVIGSKFRLPLNTEIAATLEKFYKQK